jgi:hypothetical protein
MTQPTFTHNSNFHSQLFRKHPNGHDLHQFTSIHYASWRASATNVEYPRCPSPTFLICFPAEEQQLCIIGRSIVVRWEGPVEERQCLEHIKLNLCISAWHPRSDVGMSPSHLYSAAARGIVNTCWCKMQSRKSYPACKTNMWHRDADWLAPGGGRRLPRYTKIL